METRQGCHIWKTPDHLIRIIKDLFALHADSTPSPSGTEACVWQLIHGRGELFSQKQADPKHLSKGCFSAKALASRCLNRQAPLLQGV